MDRLNWELLGKILLEQTTEALFVCEAATSRVLMANARAHALTGYHRADWEGKLLTDVLQEFVPNPLGELLEALRQNRPFESVGAFRLLCRDGSLLAVDLRVIPFAESEWRLVSLRPSQNQPTTPPRKNGSELERIAAQARDCYWSAYLDGDAQAVIRYVSAGWHSIWGYDREELQALPDLWWNATLWEDRPLLQQAIQTARARRQTQVTTYRIVTKRGEQRWVENLVLPALDVSGIVRGVDGIARDVTERVLLEAQLREEHKLEAVARLAAGIAHDFNNFLTAIMGNLALAQLERDPQQARELLGDAEKSSLAAADLIKRLLDFSRQSKADFVRIELEPLVRQIESRIRPTLEKQIELHCAVQPSLWPILADPGQMEQVLRNLLINARDTLLPIARSSRFPAARGDGKANTMPARHRAGDARVLVQVENAMIGETYCSKRLDARPGRFVRISVTDNGPGIDPTILNQIFTPFFTTKDVGKGSGLGLAIIYGIVKGHHGWITVDSQLGRGTTFHVFLPAAETVMEPRLVPADGFVTPMQNSNNSPKVSPCVMLVDHADVDRELARRILEREGYDIIEARDGFEALAIYERQRERFPLVLLAVHLPRLSAWETLARLSQLYSGVTAVLCSASPIEELPERLQQYLPAGIVKKPYRTAELTRVVREFFASTPRNGR